MLSTTDVIFALIPSLVSGLFCALSWLFMRRARKNAVRPRVIAELASSLTELQDAYEALLASHKKLRSRISMRDLREKRSNGSDMPDSTTDPAGWKRQMRLQLRKDGVLK